MGTVLTFDLDEVEVPAAEVHRAGLERGDLFGVWGTSLTGPRIERSSFDPPPSLLFATPEPDEFLMYRDGGPIGHLEVLAPGFWEEQPGFHRWEDWLARLEPLAGDAEHAETLGEAAALLESCAELEPAIASAAERVAGLHLAVHDRRWSTIADEVAAFDAAYAEADPVERFDMLLDLHSLLGEMYTEEGELIPPAMEWRDAHFDGWKQASIDYWIERHPHDRGLIGWLTTHPDYALNRVQSRGLHGEAAEQLTERERKWLAETPALFEIEEPTLFATISARVDAVWEMSDGGSRLEEARIPVVHFDLRDRVKRWREGAEKNSFRMLAGGALANMLYFHSQVRIRENVIRMAGACGRLESFLARPEAEPATMVAELEPIGADVEWMQGFGNATVRYVGEEAPRWIFQMLERRAGDLGPGPERAVLLGLAETLRVEDDGDCLKIAEDLLLRARSFRASGDEEAQLAAHADFASFGTETTGAAAAVSGNLGVALGRTIVAEAEALEDAGEWGRAALTWYRAASIGATTHAPPTRSAWLRLRVAHGIPAEADSPAVQREFWLEAAQRAALTAVGSSLPRVERDDPARELQRRFVAFQLGGRAESARTIGIRLDGLGDVAGPRDGKPHYLAQSEDGTIRWAEAGSGAPPIDLARWAIDSDGWARLRALRDELDQERADLEAASSSLRMDLPSLRERRDHIDEQVEMLVAQVDAGELSRSEGQERLESLKRVQTAVNRAIGNYNSRFEHVESTREAFNGKVREHNALLIELQKQLAVAFSELLVPAAEEWIDTRLGGAGLSAEEYAARRWLLGFAEAAPAAVPDCVEHPETLGRRVRDLNDPERAARAVDAALRARVADPQHRGVALTEHLRRLSVAFDEYLKGYGTAMLAEHLWPSALQEDGELLNAAVRGLELDRRRAVRRACGFEN